MDLGVVPSSQIIQSSNHPTCFSLITDMDAIEPARPMRALGGFNGDIYCIGWMKLMKHGETRLNCIGWNMVKRFFGETKLI